MKDLSSENGVILQNEDKNCILCQTYFEAKKNAVKKFVCGNN